MSDQPTDPTTRSPMPGSVPPDAAPPATAPPAWPRSRPSDDGRAGSIVFGLIVVGLGVWFFASETLRLEMPDIEWRQAWPVILIAVGAWIVLGTLRRRS